jgi:acetyl esterase/lipase
MTLLRQPLAVPYLFLAAALIGVLFVLNAQRPFARSGSLAVGVFFAGWLTGELPLQHLAWQLVVTGAFVEAGALSAWPGFVGLGIAALSCAGLLRMFFEARRSGGVVERALDEALGERYLDRVEAADRARMTAPQPLGQILLPFALRHPEVERLRDISYGPYGRRNLLDVYRPRADRADRAGARRRPVLVQVHGGAWVLGDKDRQGLPLMIHLASLGWICVAINYRLSPRSTFPDHVVDVKRALAWVKANVASYGGDPDFVVLTGGSAGGHLSALAALTPNDPEYQPGFEDADTSVAACVPFYGVYDFTNRKGVGRRDLIAFLARLVIKRPFDEARDVFDRASPMSRVNDRAPPFLVLHGTHDTMVPVEEARLFVELLRARSRQPVAYAELPGAQHAFEVFASARTGHVVRGVARFLAWVHAGYLEQREAPALPAADRVAPADREVRAAVLS